SGKRAVPGRLFECFFIISAPGIGSHETGGHPYPPKVVWQFDGGGGGTTIPLQAVLPFCFPDPESASLRRFDTFAAEDFTFVLTDSNAGRCYGFCRHVLPCGPGGRYDVGRWRAPECLCLVSRFPHAGLFRHLLQVAHGIRLLAVGAAGGGGGAGNSG
ncbi:unnamed protein product, partial [Phaeothamnion confervicola]